jgi:hypothetical protein
VLRLRTCAAAVLLALAWALVPGAATAKRTSGILTQKYDHVRWKLQIRTDRFSGDIRCRLHGRSQKLVYTAGAVGFRVGGHREIYRAWFRIDAGQPQRWRDELPELARLQAPMAGRDMDRPTDGFIWLPADLIEGAREVAIMRRPGRKPKIFRVDGLADALEAAVQAGCTPDSRFIP